MKHKLNRMVAYVSMPFLFVLLGYSIIYIALAPGIELLQATIIMVMAKEIPDFHQELKTIYNPAAKEETDSQQTEGLQVNDNEVDFATNQTEAAKIEEIVDIRGVQFPDQGTHFAELYCERIGLEVPIYWGDTKEILSAGVGQFIGSFLPGFGRSILLSGHNTTYFKSLELIEDGDIIYCKTNYGVFEYRVTEVTVMKAEDAENMLNDMLSALEEELIMYTCYPFKTLVGNKEDRLFVFADKISGPTVE